LARTPYDVKKEDRLAENTSEGRVVSAEGTKVKAEVLEEISGADMFGKLGNEVHKAKRGVFIQVGQWPDTFYTRGIHAAIQILPTNNPPANIVTKQCR
jgi:hypothetical protein